MCKHKVLCLYTQLALGKLQGLGHGRPKQLKKSMCNLHLALGILNSTSVDSINHGRCNAVVFTSEKSLNRRGPRQLKPVSLQGQLHSSPNMLVKVVFICSVNIRGDAEVKGITSFPLDKALSPHFHVLCVLTDLLITVQLGGEQSPGLALCHPLAAKAANLPRDTQERGWGTSAPHSHWDHPKTRRGTYSLPRGADSPEQA